MGEWVTIGTIGNNGCRYECIPLAYLYEELLSPKLDCSDLA
jgi:hypothetical protein